MKRQVSRPNDTFDPRALTSSRFDYGITLYSCQHPFRSNAPLVLRSPFAPVAVVALQIFAQSGVLERFEGQAGDWCGGWGKRL